MERLAHPVYAYVSFILVVAILSLHACTKENLDIPPAIQERVDNEGCDPSCPSFLDKYLWHNQTVYILSCSGAACNCRVSVFDAQGNELNPMSVSYNFSHFTAEAELQSHLWRCDR
jgi:hypothetical protein